MSELQIGLLAIGGRVVAGVLVYNRVQERGARRETERAFRSGHADVLLSEAPARIEPTEAPRTAPVLTPVTKEEAARPDSRVDYIADLSFAQPVGAASLQEPWRAIERRHARRVLVAGGQDGRGWQAALQLVSRDGPVSEADLIEFRSALDALAAAHGGSVSAPEMRAAVDAARQLDEVCSETDIQVVMHLTGGPFAGTKIRAAAEASGLALEPDGRFALRDDDGRLLYTLGARDGAPFTADGMRTASPSDLTLALDVARAPETRRTFESMTRLGHQLVSVLG